MFKRSIEELIRDIRQRREFGERSMVLLLGAGASIEAGVGAMPDLLKFINRKDFTQFVSYIETLKPHERFRLLGDFLSTREPSVVTSGYLSLAALCADSYFDIVLTTNLDPLLDDALSNARLWRKDYLLLVNGVVRSDRVKFLLTAESPRLKVLKLHGDLFLRIMAWTPREMDLYISEIEGGLNSTLDGRDLLVVGHSLRDKRIREMAIRVARSQRTLWFLNPKTVPEFLQKEKTVSVVIDKRCSFEKLFPFLAESLGAKAAGYRVGIPERPSPEQLEGVRKGTGHRISETTHDFMESVVSISGKHGSIATGFILAEPRCIVTDAYSGRMIAERDSLTVISRGQSFKTKVIKTVDTHPFGPMFIKAPPRLWAPGLSLDARPLTPGMGIKVGVAAGDRIGISSGRIETVKEQRREIAPIGMVRNLIELVCSTAPGACGAPVVDDSFRVRGFVVAGSRDPDRPVSFMYPARRWKKEIPA